MGEIGRAFKWGIGIGFGLLVVLGIVFFLFVSAVGVGTYVVVSGIFRLRQGVFGVPKKGSKVKKVKHKKGGGVRTKVNTSNARARARPLFP